MVICSSANDELLLVHLAAAQRGHVLQQVDRASRRSPGAWIATTLRCPLTWLCTSICSAVPSTVSATITSGRRSARMILSSTGMIDWTSLIFSAEKRMYGSSRTAEHAAGVGDQVRRDVAVVELEVLDEVDRQAQHRAVVDGDDAVVADGVQGLRDDPPDRLVVVGRDRGDPREVLQGVHRVRDRRQVLDDRARRPGRCPRLTSTGLPPEAIAFMPSRTMACARTVAVVVPSPTVSLVLTAASLTSWAPMFSNGSRR